MSLTRRLVLAAGLFCAVAAPTFAADAPYLTAEKLDLRNFLPPAIVAGSPADLAERTAVVAAQKAASPERIALAQHDADETVWVIFGKTLGDKFTAAALPLTDRFFARVGDSEDLVVDPAKPFFGRVRPFLAAPDEIKPLVKASKSGSYPSGHTTRGTMEGIILVSMLPEKRAEIWARVDEYAESRIVGGMHYPGDLVAGKRAGSAMAAAMFADPAFVADFEAVKKEVRAALGL
ncbi:phosphatase PAP2 family protein [Siculibacillus lacustris]|uniref:Acid phosphatase n=1 Tax=Siculibacillus lacustris TaxID=1549641 RepID=A0A4Q9VT71_9HYPH|nr:phosphatase PAP2 family protein [Siculibacillus lacustris]TBW39252.1 phosphatase PAP2 family protein [Siculibacillus lacustris]